MLILLYAPSCWSSLTWDVLHICTYLFACCERLLLLFISFFAPTFYVKYTWVSMWIKCVMQSFPRHFSKITKLIEYFYLFLGALYVYSVCFLELRKTQSLVYSTLYLSVEAGQCGGRHIYWKWNDQLQSESQTPCPGLSGSFSTVIQTTDLTASTVIIIWFTASVLENVGAIWKAGGWEIWVE